MGGLFRLASSESLMLFSPHKFPIYCEQLLPREDLSNTLVSMNTCT